MYAKIKKMLEEELEHITRKGELSTGSLDAVDTLTRTIKNIDTICAMAEYEDDYSRDGEPIHHANINRYDGASYGRGRGRSAKRDSMGRYSSGGYSYDDAKSGMIMELREAMEKAPDETAKRRVEALIKEMEKT